MLVSLAVLGFLMVGLNQGVRTGLDLWKAQFRRLETTADLDATARLLRSLLAGLPISPDLASDPGAPPVPISFAGTADRLAFVGDIPTGFGTTRRADITLALRDQRLLLIWTPHRHQVGGTAVVATETEVLRGVAHLELAYWDSTSPDGTPGWLSQWDGPAIPGFIRIRLRFAEEDARRWPDLIVAPLLWMPGI